MTTLLNQFCEFVALLIDEDGIHPTPAMWRDRDSDEVVVAMLDLEPMEVLNHAWRKITCEGAVELVFGLDRFTLPGQGTEFAGVLACGHWCAEFHESWNQAWKPFVINYQYEPRIVRPPDFANDFWNAKILGELKGCCPTFRVREDRVAATRTQEPNR